MTYRNTGKNTSGGSVTVQGGQNSLWDMGGRDTDGTSFYGFGVEVAKTGGRLVHKLILRQCDGRNYGPFKSSILVRWFMIY